MSAVIDSPPYFLRPMDASDLPAILQIEAKVYDYPWSEQIFIDCIRVGYVCRVCEIAGQVVAYTVVSTGAGEAHVLNLCVDPDFQGKGLGKELLTHIIELVKDLNVDSIFLEVRPTNLIALSLYDQLGFNQIGTRKGYYPAKFGREDAVVLALGIAPPVK